MTDQELESIRARHNSYHLRANFASMSVDQVNDLGDCSALLHETTRLRNLLNTPEIHDFTKAVALEGAHQRERWAADDPSKGDADWFWLIGYLAGKALHTPIMKDCAEGLMFAPHANILDKKLHRIVTVAAAAANWHAFVSAVRRQQP